MRLLHAIHDFLPRYRAGSEVYALTLAHELARRHHVTILCADYDPVRPHGEVVWRLHEGLPVVEVINNWVCGSFEDTYRSPVMGDRLRHVLRAVQPDVVHVHNLLNLSFDLPSLARAAGIPVVATLHDYTLVCASGGQRIHRADHYVCHEIDLDRCARCFSESPFQTRMSLGLVAAAPAPVRTLAGAVRRQMPALTRRLAEAAPRPSDIDAAEMARRLAAARNAWQQIDLFVAPSQSIATEFERLGLPASRIRVSDYGFPAIPPPAFALRASAGQARVAPGASAGQAPLRIGYVGTLVWHKGAHVLIDAVRELPPASCEVKIFGDPHVFRDYASDLRARASGLPVTFMGPFDRPGMADAYGSFDVLVVPSLWLENSPLVIHEAYQSGVPVIGSRIGGIADLVRDGWNGQLFEPGSAADLAAVLRRVIEQPACLQVFAGRLPAVKSIGDDCLEWEARYAEVLNGRT
ncbi:MAG TPA: glycosyltransferase family 4 protein [Vicinamibacterales bacterium]|nr:glycosyltransferase family 4 protein [Vicinamibacterales bacterium]